MMNSKQVANKVAVDAANDSNVLVADVELVLQVQELKALDANIKAQQEHYKKCRAVVEAKMGDAQKLVNKDGIELVSWKQGKEVDKLDAKQLKANFYDVWYACVSKVPGARRFLIK